MSEETTGFTEAPAGTIEIGCYASLRKANDHALVILSMRLAYWMFPDQGKYRLFVDAAEEEAVRDQLTRFDRENRFWPPKPLVYEKGNPVPILSFLPYLVLLIVTYLIQHRGADLFGESGRMDVVAFVGRHEWWRTITSLTLHSDLAHLIGNLGMGCFFAFFVVQLFGAGSAWLAILLAGALGNAVCACFYYPSEFYSIGASTAVFAAVGLSVGHALKRGIVRYRASGSGSILLPLFVAAVMLGWWGSAGERTDVTSHLFGLLSGILIGGFLSLVRPERLKKFGGIAAVISLLIVLVAWGTALGSVNNFLET